MKIPAAFRNPRYLLPLIFMVGCLVLGLRVNDVWTAARDGKMFTRTAQAETKEEKKEEKHEEEKKADAPPKIDVPAIKDEAKSEGESKSSIADAPIAPPKDQDVSPAEMEVLKQLADRRDQLDKRGREMDKREALLKVAEQRVDQKIKSLEALRNQLQAMVGQASEAQAAQTENLVKIYETMKPDEAAKIFETLDMPILLKVIQKMKPARTAPIMAKMAPEKAKELTIALTKQDQLPQIK